MSPASLAGITLPPLTLIPAAIFSPELVAARKRETGRPVLLAFPVKGPQEKDNLQQLLTLAAPYHGSLFDEAWLALGGDTLGGLADLPRRFPWLRIFPVKQQLPPDQQGLPLGKGGAMRALLHHWVSSGIVRDRQAIIYFCDADIRPQYFHPGWLAGPLGSLLWPAGVEAAKVVYFRPQGGRLNAMLRGLLAALPCPELQPLQQLVYLLSGEMAATLKFWTAMPFKGGYGVEIFLLAALALGLIPPASGIRGLDQMVQVFVGDMDHRHAPLTTDLNQIGLDHMATGVFAALFEALELAGQLCWRRKTAELGPLYCPVPVAAEPLKFTWRTCPVGEATLPPLIQDPELLTLLI